MRQLPFFLGQTCRSIGKYGGYRQNGWAARAAGFRALPPDAACAKGPGHLKSTRAPFVPGAHLKCPKNCSLALGIPRGNRVPLPARANGPNLLPLSGALWPSGRRMRRERRAATSTGCSRCCGQGGEARRGAPPLRRPSVHIALCGAGERRDSPSKGALAIGSEVERMDIRSPTPCTHGRGHHPLNWPPTYNSIPGTTAPSPTSSHARPRFTGLYRAPSHDGR